MTFYVRRVIAAVPTRDRHFDARHSSATPSRLCNERRSGCHNAALRAATHPQPYRQRANNTCRASSAGRSKLVSASAGRASASSSGRSPSTRVTGKCAHANPCIPRRDRHTTCLLATRSCGQMLGVPAQAAALVTTAHRNHWRRGSESNRPRRICNPLHNLSATPPGTRSTMESHGCTDRADPAQTKREASLASLARPCRPLEWSGKRDSNSRPQPWQGCALPTELFPHSTQGPDYSVRVGRVNLPASPRRSCLGPAR